MRARAPGGGILGPCSSSWWRTRAGGGYPVPGAVRLPTAAVDLDLEQLVHLDLEQLVGLEAPSFLVDLEPCREFSTGPRSRFSHFRANGGSCGPSIRSKTRETGPAAPSWARRPRGGLSLEDDVWSLVLEVAPLALCACSYREARRLVSVPGPVVPARVGIHWTGIRTILVRPSCC